MIKINLLPQRRVKRSASEPSARAALLGAGALAAAGVLVFVTVDRSKRDELKRIDASNEDLRVQIARQNKDLQGYNEMVAAKKTAETRASAIERLIHAKVVPAHVLHELGEILTTNRLPTMTDEMTRRVGTGQGSDPNRRFQLDWDPSHVWMSAFTDTAGVFLLEGGAQSESDVTQLSKRLAASVYFIDVTPAGGERMTDIPTGMNYYHFTITGKLAY